MTPSADRRAAFSAVEIVLLVLIAGVALVPIYTSFIKTGETTIRSEIAYKAMQVAREELQEIRTMPLWGVPARPATPYREELPAIEPYTGHEWEPVVGENLFHRSATPAKMEAPLADLTYPDSYRGIETRCLIMSPAEIPGSTLPPEHMDAEHVRIIRIEVRWQEKGEEEKGGELKTGIQLFTAIAVKRGAT